LRSSLKWTLIITIALCLGIIVAAIAQTLTELPATSPVKPTDPHMNPFQISPETIDHGFWNLPILDFGEKDG